LHSEESYLTAIELMNIAHKLHYNLYVLPETIKEYRNLINRKADANRGITIFSATRKETIEYGCMRRGLKSTDLDLYSAKIGEILRVNHITTIESSVNSRLGKEVESTEVYKVLKDRPNNPEGAMHDAMAINYVKSFWSGSETSITEIPAFFVTDTQGYLENKVNFKTKLPCIIRTDELLNILWLANPQTDLAISKLHLAKLSVTYFDKSLPKKELMYKLDQKIQRIKGIPVNASDCVEIAMNLAVMDSNDLKGLLSAEEDSLVRDKITELAIVARRLNEKERERMQNSIQRMIELSEEYNKSKIKAFENEISDIRKKKEIEAEEIRNTFNYQAIKAKKEYFAELIKRDKEEIDITEKNISKEKMKLKTRLTNESIVITAVISVILFFICKTLIVPNWTILEGYSYGLSIVVALVPVIFSWKYGSKINIEKILRFLNRSLNQKIVEYEERISILSNRINENELEIRDIII
jgi:hypothetical protein